MENLFLEILRILDIRYNKTNTDYYFFSSEYYKMILMNNINEETMLNIFVNNVDKKKSLFMASKLEKNEVINKINFNNPDFNFYKSRDILFFICIFLKYLITDNTNTFGQNVEDYNVEKKFINNFISEDLIKKFINIIKEFKARSFVTLYDNKSFFKIIKDNHNFNEEIDKSLLIAIKLYFDYNLFTVGLKKSLDYKFEVSVFYIMLNIISNRIEHNKISQVYLSIEK